MSSCPLRITVFTPVKSPEGGWTRLLVEYKVKDLDSDRLEACQIFYPEDETALGFRRFATLVRNYVGQSSR